METSRGCTRSCNFCSIRHMYGKSFRTFPIARVLADLDDIYYKRNARWVFISDDNLVLDPKRVMALCDAIIERDYKGLTLVVQADCLSMSRNEEMVAKMARAGMRSIFLGIENVSQKNLALANKGDIVSASRRSVALCHKYGIMVVGGLVVGVSRRHRSGSHRESEVYEGVGCGCALLPDSYPIPQNRHPREPARGRDGHQ